MRRMCYVKFARAFMSGIWGPCITVANAMPGHRARPLIAVALASAALALAGCGAAERIPYPKFSSVSKVTKKLLTREEKDAAIEEMTLERNRQREEAGEPERQ